jgi:hypothetical protein
LMIRTSHGLASGSLCPLSRFGIGVLIRYNIILKTFFEIGNNFP